MKYSILKKIRESIDAFDDSEFDSLLAENIALVKNTKTGNLYSIPFKVYNNENIVFEAEEAKMLEKNDFHFSDEEETLKDIISEKVLNIKESLMNFFENGNISIVKESIASNLDYIKLVKEDKLSSYVESKDNENEPLILESTEFKSLSENEKEYIREIKKTFASKVNEYNFIKNSFFENGRLFNESGKIKKESFLNPLKIVKLYNEKKEIREEITNNFSIISEFYESVTNQTDLSKTEENIIFKDINLLNEADFKISLAKNLVILKKSYPESNVAELTRKINNVYNETFKNFKSDFDFSNLEKYEEMISTLTTDSNSETPSFRFLKFKMGVFTPSDLATLRSEFDEVIKNCYGMSREALMTIQEMRDKIDFMLKTGRIDDEQVGEIINQFNSSYGEVENSELINNWKYTSEYDDEDDLEEDYENEDENDDYFDDEYETDEYEDEEDYEESNGPTDLKEAIRRAKEKVRNNNE